MIAGRGRQRCPSSLTGPPLVWRVSPVFRSFSYSAALPPRSDRNAMNVSSGDHRGPHPLEALVSVLVRALDAISTCCRSRLPDGGAAKTARDPSGDHSPASCQICGPLAMESLGSLRTASRVSDLASREGFAAP